MEQKNIIFRMAARCEAAGRHLNEDNYQISDDLAAGQWGFTADRQVNLGDKGALMVVCDGMGGMNAGEVASAIAVKVVKECFDTANLTNDIIASPTKIKQFIKDTIQRADATIKEQGAANKDYEGMGSTIVMAWLLNNTVYIGWCGDSRAYRYNPKTGLERLSHDHSYVQNLIDAGELTEDLAFDHPNSNIITRSLGDPNGTAQPDVKSYDVTDEDIIMLCSDGLCGNMRDNDIKTIIEQNQSSMQQCRDELWEADRRAEWHDNVTITLLQILAGCSSTEIQKHIDKSNKLQQSNKRLKILLSVIIALIVIGLALYFYLTCK